MPLGAVLPVAVFVFVAFVGGQREFRYRLALRSVFNFGIFAQVAEKNDFVNALSCHEKLLGTRVADESLVDVSTNIPVSTVDEPGITLSSFESGKTRHLRGITCSSQH